ncbi:MAG TPA: hypothetical protein VII11_10075, partial [Bacteroidota bacterium]
MKRLRSLFSLLVFCILTAHAQPAFPTYSSQDFQFTSPGAMKFGLYGYDNPATINLLHQPDFYFTWSDASGTWNDFNRWGLFTAFNPVGFGFIHQKTPDGYYNDFRFSLAGGTPALSTGFSIGWSRGETRLINRTTHVSLGFLSRPNPYLSFGAVGTTAFSQGNSEAVLDVATRPLGNEKLAFFADYAVVSGQSLSEGGWSAGVATEVLPGIRIVGRYFDTKAYAVGVQLSLGHIGVGTQAHFDKNQNHSYNTYAVRIGAYDR